jgi:hypothetical protein
MAATLSVPFVTVADEGIEEGWPGADGPFARVTLRCDWDDRYKLVSDLVGTAAMVAGKIVRVPAFAYPASPNLFGCAIETIKPFGKPTMLKYLPLGSWLGKDKADVTVRFEVPKWGLGTEDASGQPYTTTTMNVSGEFLTFPESTYTFEDAFRTPTNTPIGLIIPQNQISFKRHMLPYLPVFEMLSLSGFVNGAVFSIGNFTCPIGTLLFLGGPTTVTADTLGHILQEVEYQFIYRRVPWNMYFHPDGRSGPTFVSDKLGNRPYPSGDFTILP